MSYRSQQGQRSSDKPIVRIAFMAVIFSVIANMGLQYFRADNAQEEASAVTVQLKDLSGQTAACVDSGDARSEACRVARGKAVEASQKPVAAPEAREVTVTRVTPYPSPYPVTQTEVVPLPFPSATVVTVTAPGSSQPGKTSTSVTTTPTTVTKTEVVQPPAKTQTKTETSTETSTETKTTVAPCGTVCVDVG